MKVPEFPCNDCSVNTVPLEGGREYYEVLDSLWESAGCPGIGQSDNGLNGFYLCIGCLETRIGRELTTNDFKPYPANTQSPWLSLRLNSRLRGRTHSTGGVGLDFIPGPKANTPMFFPNALTGAVLSRFKPEVHNISPTGAYAIIKTRQA